ncbi:MAG: ferrous iron transport protein A [Pyrinomonadaceae bacterium]|nr:ferrous iron transport protein A [Pyrinomonadaceae bacterium]MCX7640514.1 ferrous iron transport protein A [Pyrinomonadaceae bacterium]MDW8303905.1 ferrous iron transport protein A [Acidobacteriota bacterium]
MSRSKTLATLSAGESAIIKSIREGSTISKRLMEMGLLPGAYVEVVKEAPFGSPVQIRIKGYNLALRKSEAEFVEVY